ncbi:MAG: outer membrane beta-barrel protein [Chitinophagaceae bacterium]|jgi:hypothetical protein|nr:outer membrane beta-barrel protein [Chitinophagaceae bacterium]
MLRSVILFLFAIVIVKQLHAQKITGAFKGFIIDSSKNAPIPGATIAVINFHDSSLVSYSVSDKQGFFEIKNFEIGRYMGIISHQGLETVYKPFSIDSKTGMIDVGKIPMVKQFIPMGEVIVKNVIPIYINGDTVQFNADAFKTKPNATVEDLLKKLPGIIVDKNGHVNAQGADVQKILVDGKEFFGTDPKMATKNLTADMIESIQVFDDMSEHAKFTKMDDGTRSKSINLKLKKDKKKGNFGRALLSAGTQNRYEANLSMNRFDGDQQLSFLTNINNINKTGSVLAGTGGSMFSPGFGGSGAFGTRNDNGISRSISSGLNFNNDWGTKFKINGSYSFSNKNHQHNQETFRRTFFPEDSIALYSSMENAKNIHQNHRFNLRFEYMIDSMNTLLYIPQFTVLHAENFNNDSSFTLASKPGLEYLALTNRNTNTQIQDGRHLSQNLLYRKKFIKDGRTFTLGWNNTLTSSKDLGNNISPYTLYKQDGSIDRFRDQNQQSRRQLKTNNNLLSSSITEAIGKNKLVEINYAYTYNQNTSDKQVMDYNNSSKKYDITNLPLTNYFENIFNANRIGANFRLQQEKYHIQIGGAAQFSHLTSKSFRALTNKDSLTKQRYTNIFPTATFRYSIEKNKNLGFNYRGRTKQPSIIQLQDVPDVSNPLQVYIGNPLLGQEFNHSVSLNYTEFNKINFKYASYNLSINTTDNKIVNSIDSADRGVQIIMPVNHGGNYNISSLATFGFPFKHKKLQGSGLNFSTALAYHRDVSILYKSLNIGKTISASQSAGANLNLNEQLHFGLNANLAYNQVSYSVNTLFKDASFTQVYSADVTCFLPLHIILSTDIDYYINSGRTDGFNQKFTFWNAYVAKELFGNKQAEIRFSINDILNQNKSIERFTGENFIEDTRSNVLQRYFMISFMYNLSKLVLGGKAPLPPPEY